VQVKLTSRVSIVVVAVLLYGATPGFPQEAGFQPLPGGLFGATENRTARHNLDFSFSLAEAYDSDVPAELRGIGPNDALVSGGSTMIMGHTEYHWQSSRVQVGATGESALRHYNQLAQVKPFSYSSGIGLSAHLGGRTTLLANQSAAYSPSYLYGLFPSTVADSPGDAVPTAPDYAASDFDSFTYGTTVTLTQGLTRRSRVSASGEIRHTDFAHETATLRDVNSQGIRGEFSHNLALHTAVQIGYEYRTGTFGYGGMVEPGASATEHRMLVGFEHSHQLSATRRMIVDASFGSSVVIPSASADGSDQQRQYLPSGDVSVAWQFRESWQARGAFRRGLEYVPGLSEPVFANGFTANVSGLLTSRFDCAASARYSSGASAFGGDALTFDMYATDFRIRFAVTRTLAVYGAYLYYFYDFPRNALAPGIPPGLERNAVRAGLTLWLPAVRR
jgi:hypothetical protein